MRGALEAVSTVSASLARSQGFPTEVRLRLLIEENTKHSLGIDEVVDRDSRSPALVDNHLRDMQSLTDLESELYGQSYPKYTYTQLHIKRRTIADERFDPQLIAKVAPVTGATTHGTAMPVEGGLWTSSEYAPEQSSWDLWMEVGGESSSFIGSPSKWRLFPRSNFRKFVVAGASSWVELVTHFPKHVGGNRIAPDWETIAKHYDAVHVSLRGAIATQCISYTTKSGARIKPAYFDIESTMWTSWCFDSFAALLTSWSLTSM